MKKIDIHCHISIRESRTAGKWCRPSDIITKMQEYDIEKTVVLASYRPDSGSGVSNFRVKEWIREHPELLFFGSLDFETYFKQGSDELEELGENGSIKGIKIYSGYQKIDFNSGEFRRVYALAEKYALPLMFHCGYTYRRTGVDDLGNNFGPEQLERIAQYGDVPIIASHMARPYTRELMAIVKRNPQIYTDVSGLIDSNRDRADIPECVREIRAFLEECGPTHLLFGTDYPVQTYDDSIHFIEEAMKGFNDSDKEKVYYTNAANVLKITS